MRTVRTEVVRLGILLPVVIVCACLRRLRKGMEGVGGFRHVPGGAQCLWHAHQHAP